MFQPERKFGVVVVGVGRAGSVRIRDLRSPHASSAFLNLIGFVSRWLCFVPCNSLGAGCNGLGFSRPQREQASSGVIPGNCAGSAPQDLRQVWELNSAGPATGMCSESSYRGQGRGGEGEHRA